jgi:uncharacterized protein (TIGR02145 family)
MSDILTTKCVFAYLIILAGVVAVAGGCKKDDDDDNVKDNTITDIRDNNVYKIVTIGNQVWMAENLRYSGDIPQVIDNEAWELIAINETREPAWCYYDNNPSFNNQYGKLYNWYAVHTGTLCPPGWHIPSHAEWEQLSDFLGGSSIAGGKMKSLASWESPNEEATNESGFSGLPGGVRWSSGEFLFAGRQGGWWSSDDEGIGSSVVRILFSGDGILRPVWDSQSHGYSCRCLRD